MCLGASGTGKTYLQEKVSELIPEEDKIEITSLIRQCFLLLRQRRTKTQTDLNRGSGRSRKCTLSAERITIKKTDKQDRNLKGQQRKSKDNHTTS